MGTTAEMTVVPALEETRETGQRELAALAGWRESLRASEGDRISPRALRYVSFGGLGPPERRTVYSVSKPCVQARPLVRLRRAGRGGFILARQNVNKMMQQVQKMQQEMQQAQEELARETVTASAGGGAVKATMTGGLELVSLEIDPEVLDPEDVEMLQDMVLAAVNESLNSAQELASKRLGGITGGLGDLGLNIPGM